MFEYDQKLLESLGFIMLYPPDGDSSVLEVSDENIGPFLHIMLASDKTLIFAFFPMKNINLSEAQFTFICEKARQQLSLTDISMFES